MYFPVNPLSWRLNRGVINEPISEPEIIGYYSVNGEQKYVADSSEMRYYNPPKLGRVHMDLNQGIESAILTYHNSAGGSINDILEWVTRNSDKILDSKTDKWIEPKFVTSAGMLTNILFTPFVPDASWIICAAKFKGTIYLCRFRSPQELYSGKMTPGHYSSWGYKFEQYIVSDYPDKPPDTFRPVIEPAEFRCVYRRRFGNHDVMFTAELDAVRSEKVLEDPLPLKQLKFVELKTKKILNYDGQVRIFQKDNALQWWAQNFTTGIEDVLCGFRNENGIVQNLVLYSRDRLIKLGQPYWDPITCINFCQDFLNFVDKNVVEDFDRVIYKFEKLYNRDIKLTREEPTSSYAFLPHSFIARTMVEPAEFRCVFTRRFGKHDLLFNAEIDAVRSEKVLKDPLPLEQLKFVELKTKKILSYDGQVRIFQKDNALQWWAQNYATGVDDVLCGFRNDDGIVHELKLYTRDDLIEQGELYWNPEAWIEFCQNFLDRVKKTVEEDYDSTIYRFIKKPFCQISVSKEKPESEYAFLPSSFVAKTG